MYAVKSMRWVLVVVAVAGLGCSAEPSSTPTLDIATTTSVQNSGLLDALLPAYAAAEVRVHAAGSGRALAMLADGTVPLVISHAPEAEAEYVRQHQQWRYRKIAYNHFIVVGPRADPAKVSAAPDVADAFRRIATAPVFFISRGDQSGTHERELALWKLAAAMPPPDRLLISGAGMAQALRHTDEENGYTLSDEATFWQLEKSLSLVQLFDRDPRLLNTYAVIYPAGNARAEHFAKWLINGDGRDRIEKSRIQGRPAFSVWPANCPADEPPAVPCQ
jgi:tungstate transport system substrate-binding protein